MQSPSLVSSFSLMVSKSAAAQPSPEFKPENPFIPSVQQKEVLLFEWWLMNADKGYNGRRLIVGGFTKRGEAVAIFKSAPIIKRHDHCTLETADGITLRIEGPINKTRTIDNGFSLEASNAFLFGFPTTWDNFAEESSGNKPSDSRMLEHQTEITFDPSFQQKTVLLRNWWLRKAEKGTDGNRLAVGGFTECGKAMRLFDSSPIIKRHDAYTLETADGITIRIEGFINKTRTLDNGFPLEACKSFLIGFPTTWTDFANGSSRDKSSHTEIPVSASRGAEWLKDSLENVPFGFLVKSENTILENVPSTSNTSVRDSDTRLREAIHKFIAWVSMSNTVQIPLADRGSHHLEEKNICDNNRLQDESCGANMTDAHTNYRLQDDESCGTDLIDAHSGYNDYEAGHTPVDNDSENHEASCTEGVHTEGAGCLTGDLHVDGLPQEKSLNHTGYNDYEAGHTPVNNDSENHEASCTEGVHTDGAGCLTGGLHVDGLPQEKSLNHEKLEFIQDAALNIYKKSSGHAVTNCHHDERVGTRSTSNLRDSIVGKDRQKEETAPKKDEKFDECSTRRPEKVRSDLSKVENLHAEDQKYAKFSVKPVRRSLRLMSLNPENVHGVKDYSQFFNETNDMNCANLVPDGSKACVANQPNDTLAERCSTLPNPYVEAQKFAKSLVKPVRKNERLVSLNLENVHEVFQDYSQFLNETNMNHANLSPDGSKTYARIQPDYTILKGSSLSPTSSILLPSTAVLSKENQDGHQHSINTCLGVTPSSNSASKYGYCDDSASTACLRQSLNDKKTFSSDCIAGPVEEVPANSKAVTSQTVGKRMLRCSRKKKNNQTDRSRMKVNQDVSRNQFSGTNFEENISFSSVSNSRRKASHLTPMSDKSSTMRTNSEDAKNVEVTEKQQAKDKASHTIGYKTVWLSSYTDVHGTPLTEYKKNKSSILTPESLNLKRSRSGRLLIPRLDCSMRAMYEPDGSFAGTATVDGSCAGTSSMVMSTSQWKGQSTFLR